MQPKNFESRIQDLVYNVDVGIGLRLIKFGLYILSILALLTLYTASEFWGLKNVEAMDESQIARQIADDGTFTTKFIRPAAVWLFEQYGTDPRTIMLKQPDIVNPPVYPWILSRTFLLFGGSFSPAKIVRAFPPEQWAVVPLGHFCTLLTGLMLFLTARRFFERRIAVLAVSLYFLSDVVWATSISGTSMAMATLFSSIVIYLSLLTSEQFLDQENKRQWMIPFFLTGFFCAITLLTRYSAGLITLTPMIMLSLLVPQKGWKLALSLLGITLVFSIPWFIRNYMVCGHFFGLTPTLH